MAELWCHGLGDTNDGFLQKAIFVSVERRRVRCQNCGYMMRLRAVAIYPPATTKIVRGLGVNLHGLGFTGPP